MREEIDAAVPRPNAACNVRSLPLSPAEGFVLSRIDGRATLYEIGATTGLGERVRDVVARLVSLGAVHRVAGLGGPRSAPPPPSVARPESVSPHGAGSLRPAPIASTPPASSTLPGGQPPSAAAVGPASAAAIAVPAPPARAARPEPSFDQALLDEACDLDLEAKRRILSISEHLDHLTHYEVLEIAPTATKKEIKAAYYRLAPEFHPDRWFRRELGSFKSRLEAIFTRITEAQNVLTSKQGRVDYDAHLATLAPAVEDIAFEELTFDEPLPSVDVDGLLDPHGAPLADIGAAGSFDDFIAQPPPRERTAEDDQRRRDALASRLRGGPSTALAAAAGSIPPPPDGPPSSGSQAAGETLKKRFDEAREANDRSQVARFLEVAELAASRNDPVSASNAYRLAAKMAPDDASLSAQVEIWSHKALVSMADAYLKQAEIDERSGRLAESAQAYLRATVGMPRSASTHERAAAMLLASEGDVRKAVEMARRAVELAPNNTTYRLTLAQAYVAAKLFVTARSELEAVLAVEPTHERAKTLLRGLPR